MFNPIFVSPRRTRVGPFFYLVLLLVLALVYLLVWFWVLSRSPEAVPVFVWFALNVGLPLLGVGVGGLAVWMWLLRRWG